MEKRKRIDFYVGLKDFDSEREDYSCWVYVVVCVSVSDHGKSCWCLLEINFEVLIVERMIRTFPNGEVTSMSDLLLQLFHCQLSVSN